MATKVIRCNSIRCFLIGLSSTYIDRPLKNRGGVGGGEVTATNTVRASAML